MILRFLRLFRSFRTLETESAVATDNYRRLSVEFLDCERERDLAKAACARSEQQAGDWKARAEKWENEYLSVNKDSIKARETVADWVSQLRFGRRIFEKAPSLPEKSSEEFQPIMKQRVQARHLVQAAEKQFEEDLREYQKRQMMGNRQQDHASDLGLTNESAA